MTWGTDMTLIFNETFEEGTPDTTIVTANSNMVIIAGAGWKFTNTNVPPGYGSMGARINPTSSSSIGSTPTWASTPVTYHDMAWHMNALPASPTVIWNLQNASGVICDVQITDLGEVKLRVNNVKVAQSPALSTVGKNVRAQFMVNANTKTVRLRVYTVSTDASPSYDSGDISAPSVSASTFASMGSIVASSIDYVMGGCATDTATYPGPSGNVAPTANAGSNQSGISAGATVTLNGSASSDPDGTLAGYTWRLVSKSPAGAPTPTLSSTSVQRPTYVAPAYSSNITYVWGLTVTDNLGAASTESTVTHTVNAQATPVANAGLNVTNIEPGSVITLDGSGSSDPGGALTGYTWRLVSKSPTGGPTPTLSSTTVQKPTYRVPPHSADVVYTWGLIVKNAGGVSSAESTVTNTVLQASDFLAVATGALQSSYWTKM